MSEPKDFYRQHTFENKGPNNKEVKAYLRGNGIFLPHPEGSEPLQSGDIARFFAQQRMARFPDQAKQAGEIAQRNAMKAHLKEKDARAKR